MESLTPVSAQALADRASSKFLAPFRTVVEKANESTIRIRCDDKDAALGTIVFPDGYILTKASELKGAITARMKDGAPYLASVQHVGEGPGPFVRDFELKRGAWARGRVTDGSTGKPLCLSASA